MPHIPNIISSPKLSFTNFSHSLNLLKLFLFVISNTNITIFEFLKNILVNDLSLSCPIVSHKYILYCFLLVCSFLIEKEALTEEFSLSLNSLFIVTFIKFVFPTPASPTRIAFNLGFPSSSISIFILIQIFI